MSPPLCGCRAVGRTRSIRHCPMHAAAADLFLALAAYVNTDDCGCNDGSPDMPGGRCLYCEGRAAMEMTGAQGRNLNPHVRAAAKAAAKAAAIARAKGEKS